MSNPDSPDDFKVGYKRPPRHSQFPPGRSGNPRGRQKGVRNFATDVKATLAGPVALNEKGKAKRVSTQEAALLRLKEKALKGDTRSLEQVIRLAQIFNDDGPDHALGGQDIAAEDREILEAYAEALQSRLFGRAAANLVPDESEGSKSHG
jgi:Family of unknown function (DUF5681)